jgi:hypothetical protein
LPSGKLKANGYFGHELEVYLVRLLFCLVADDTGIFPSGAFYNYVENSKPDGSDLPARIGKLFDVLNMPDYTKPSGCVKDPERGDYFAPLLDKFFVYCKF